MDRVARASLKAFLKVPLGLNAVALTHLLRLDARRFVLACRQAFSSGRHPGLTGPIEIPEVLLGDILGERRPSIRLGVMRYEDGTLPSEEALALLSVMVAEAPSEVLEIGTYMGHTTRLMAENLEGRVHTVDLPEGFSPNADGPPKDDHHLIVRRVVGREYQGLPCAARITQHYADTATWDFREAGRPTFFFIDGSHTYEYCRSDSEKCLEVCGGRGVFLWHDCNRTHPGVVKLLTEWRRKGRDVRRIAGTSLAYWKASG